MTPNAIELIHEGRYAAEVRVELIEEDEEGGWSPYLTVDDAMKLVTVRQTLRQGDVASAAKHGRVFELLPLAG